MQSAFPTSQINYMRQKKLPRSLVLERSQAELNIQCRPVLMLWHQVERKMRNSTLVKEEANDKYLDQANLIDLPICFLIMEELSRMMMERRLSANAMRFTILNSMTKMTKRLVEKIFYVYQLVTQKMTCKKQEKLNLKNQQIKMTRILSEVYEFSLEIIKVSLSNQITT